MSADPETPEPIAPNPLAVDMFRQWMANFEAAGSAVFPFQVADGFGGTHVFTGFAQRDFVSVVMMHALVGQHAAPHEYNAEQAFAAADAWLAVRNGTAP